MKKIIIIPIGGLGNRFKNAGYAMPKPLVNVMGNPIIYWLLENLDLCQIEYVYIPYNKELKKYRFEDQLKKDFSHINFKFYCLENNTRGAAETIKIALENLKETMDKHIMCIDSDNFYTENIINFWNGNNMIFTFEDYFTEPIFSYVQTNENNILVDIKEKCKISNNACSGIYAFSSLYKLLDVCKYIVSNNIMDKNEFYMSVVVKHMITKGEFFYNKQINKEHYHCLGTPLQVKIFCNNFQKICNKLNKNLMKIKRFCFDLDNTLVTYPKINGDYSTVDPILNNIKIVQYLKKLGHTIIIYTERKMKSFGSNTGKALANVGKITFETLEKFKIPYDEIYFGKPYADYYIDDLAVSSFGGLEKTFGFHETEIGPRDYNQIEKTDFEIIKKKSNNLDGEIYYYKNVPPEIKNLFPIFVNNDINNTWYQIEKINGISISKLYLAGELTINILKNIIDCIKIIQSCSIDENQNNVNIYANYKDKLKDRFADYDYSKFNESKILYNSLFEQLEQYEKNGGGKLSVIHGDPVFTNIFLDQYNKIKFIDMRGKLGNSLTIYGDRFYDWAKLYQSLIGYDEILDNVDLDLIYKTSMIDFFKQEFIIMFSDEDFIKLKLITKSLLFTLIPLHNNDKCYKYYDLINSSFLS